MSSLQCKVQSWNYLKEQVRFVRGEILKGGRSSEELAALVDALVDLVKIEQQFMRCFLHEVKHS